MKVEVQQVVTVKLELSFREAEAIREALMVVSEIEEGDLGDTDIGAANWRRVKELVPVLDQALFPKNWSQED